MKASTSCDQNCQPQFWRAITHCYSRPSCRHSHICHSTSIPPCWSGPCLNMLQGRLNCAAILWCRQIRMGTGLTPDAFHLWHEKPGLQKWKFSISPLWPEFLFVGVAWPVIANYLECKVADIQHGRVSGLPWTVTHLPVVVSALPSRAAGFCCS